MHLKVGMTAVCLLVGATKVDGCNRNELGNLQAGPGGDLSHVGLPSAVFAAGQAERCGSGGPTESARFLRTPYVQKTTETGFEILWVSEHAGDFTLEVTSSDGASTTAVAAEIDATAHHENGTQYVARVGGLQAGSTFCYRVVGPEGAWTTRTGTATTPAEPDAKIRFAAIGDLGKQSPDQFAVLDQMEQVDYDFVILTGDIAYDDGKRSEFERNVFEVYAGLMQNVPFFPASGNHDYKTEDAAPFREAFALFENGGPGGTERWYSFDWGPIHFAVIDTEKLEQAQIDWLEGDLSRADRPWKVIVGHRPPYSSGSHGSDKNVRNVFVPMFRRHEVDLVLMGHDHDYERTESIDGVIYVVTGGGGRGTRPLDKNGFTAFADDVAHFLWLEADASSLRMVAIDATGQQFDSLLLRND